MKKLISVVVLLAVTVCALSLAGCGGNDKATAQGYMKKGDAAMAKVMPIYGQIETTTTTFVTNYSEGKNTEPAGVKTQVAEIQALVKKTDAGVAVAKAEFKKILPLKGVEDYVNYAELAVQTIDKMKQLNVAISELLTMIEQSATTGQVPDTQKMAALGTELQKLGTEMQDLSQQASSLKTEKKL